MALAFQKFDKTGDGRVDLDDLAGVYDATKHPDVVAQQLMVFAAVHAELQEAVGVAITPESAVSLKGLRAWARERLPRQAQEFGLIDAIAEGRDGAGGADAP